MLFAWVRAEGTLDDGELASTGVNFCQDGKDGLVIIQALRLQDLEYWLSRCDLLL